MVIGKRAMDTEKNKFEKEQQELDESYQQSKRNKKEHSDKEE